ncbi:hypothetical protein HD554DRAFT_2096256 [Boletus coccyginus]|nr:hypothetical protein HD554DRAFT_2096256 [Boletus coccyginus]
MTLKPQAIQHTQPILDQSWGPFSSTRYHQENTGIVFENSSFCATAVSSSSSRSTEDVTNFSSHEMQPPVMMYRPPDKSSLGRRRSKRACAINIGELRIDKDDLHSDAGRSSGMINVHECQWAKSSNPCGMWITGSRSCVGAHIRKWHARQRHAGNTVRCLWEGCARTMLRDSLNRHVMTVHLGECFRCRGCDQEFSRKDAYNKHVKDDEVCRDAVATMMYGTEHRVIDTRQALYRGGLA